MHITADPTSLSQSSQTTQQFPTNISLEPLNFQMSSEVFLQSRQIQFFIYVKIYFHLVTFIQIRWVLSESMIKRKILIYENVLFCKLVI